MHLRHLCVLLRQSFGSNPGNTMIPDGARQNGWRAGLVYHEAQMRRGFSILLILFFGLGPLSATLEASDDASLPACCRRQGAHHCAMSMQMAAASARAQSGSTTPQVSAPVTCPFYPGLAACLVGPAPALAAAAISLPSLTAQSYRPASSRTAALSHRSRIHSVRGPPATI